MKDRFGCCNSLTKLQAIGTAVTKKVGGLNLPSLSGCHTTTRFISACVLFHSCNINACGTYEVSM